MPAPTRLLSIISLAVLVAVPSAFTQCTVGFDPDFYSGNVNPDLGVISDASAYTTSTGMVLVLAVRTEYTGGVVTYDGARFRVIGSTGSTASVRRVFAHQTANGVDIYAAGNFSKMNGVSVPGIARFDGERWHPVGSIAFGGSIDAMTAFDDGNGEQVYVGGTFMTATGAPTDFVASWDGTSWNQLGTGVDNAVQVFEVHDDGSGLKLWMGGRFSLAGGAASTYLAAWDGAVWSTFGSFITHDFVSGFVGIYALESVQVGTESGLYVGGVFSRVAGLHTGAIARYDGTNWHGLGSVPATTLNEDIIDDIALVSESGASTLYIGGHFASFGGITASDVVRYDLAGGFMQPGGGTLGGDFSQVRRVIPSQIAMQPGVWLAGDISLAGAMPVVSLCRWDGVNWHSVDPGVGLADEVSALAAFDDGQGERLYAATKVSPSLSEIWSFDGNTWTLVTTGINGRVVQMTSYDDGNGAKLYIGGGFSSVAGVAASHLARFDGATWQDVGGGLLPGANLDSTVRTMHVSDVSGSPILYIGGSFSLAGGVLVNSITAWNGTTFSPIGIGVTGLVASLATYVSNGNRELWIGGQFSTTLNGSVVFNLIRWNGVSAVPHGVFGGAPVINALTTYKNQLYVAGQFSMFGGNPAAGFARFDGSTWTGLPSGPIGATTIAYSAVMTVYHDGASEKLFVHHRDDSGGSATASRLAIWNGTTWSFASPTPTGGTSVMPGSLVTSAVAKTSRGSSLYVGGGILRPGHSVARFGPLNDETASCAALGDGAEGSVGVNAGGPFPVLRVNSSFGNGDHRVNLNIGQNLSVNVQRPPTVTGAAPFVLWGYLGEPSPTQALSIGGVGTFVFPPCHPLVPFDPASFVLFDSLGSGSCAPLVGAPPAPFTMSFPGGVPFSFQVTLQGLIIDPSATFGVASTNAVIVVVGP